MSDFFLLIKNFSNINVYNIPLTTSVKKFDTCKPNNFEKKVIQYKISLKKYQVFLTHC